MPETVGSIYSWYYLTETHPGLFVPLLPSPSESSPSIDTGARGAWDCVLPTYYLLTQYLVRDDVRSRDGPRRWGRHTTNYYARAKQLPCAGPSRISLDLFFSLFYFENPLFLGPRACVMDEPRERGMDGKQGDDGRTGDGEERRWGMHAG